MSPHHNQTCLEFLDGAEDSVNDRAATQMDSDSFCQVGRYHPKQALLAVDQSPLSFILPSEGHDMKVFPPGWMFDMHHLEGDG